MVDQKVVSLSTEKKPVEITLQYSIAIVKGDLRTIAAVVVSLKIEKGRPHALYGGRIRQHGCGDAGDLASRTIGEHPTHVLDVSPRIVVLHRHLVLDDVGPVLAPHDGMVSVPDPDLHGRVGTEGRPRGETTPRQVLADGSTGTAVFTVLQRQSGELHDTAGGHLCRLGCVVEGCLVSRFGFGTSQSKRQNREVGRCGVCTFTVNAVWRM